LPTTQLYSPSLHDALPISAPANTAEPTHLGKGLYRHLGFQRQPKTMDEQIHDHEDRANIMSLIVPFQIRLQLKLEASTSLHRPRSEEHTSELQSRENLVCR